MITNVFKNGSLYVDGENYVGQVKTFSPPDITETTIDLDGGGMIGTVDAFTGFEKLEPEFTMQSWDPDIMALYGIRTGNELGVTYRAHLEDQDGEGTPAALIFRGRIKQLSLGDLAGREQNEPSYMMSAHYHRLEIDGNTILELDFRNHIAMINGVDVWEQARENMGI